MIDVLKMEYWSRADAFLLPLTKLKKTELFNPHMFMFWENRSIEDYTVMLTYDWEDKQEFNAFCSKEVFPILDYNGYLLENYDCDNKSIFVLDMSEWAMDIEMLLKRRYSKLSKSAKKCIKDYHKTGDEIDIEIYSTIEPLSKQSILGNENALNYVSKNYDIPLIYLDGEIGSKYNKKKETLFTKSDCYGEDERGSDNRAREDSKSGTTVDATGTIRDREDDTGDLR